ncbi:Transmembrane protein [Orchesella cincta]|uniref:Transmembrane protein n=1 Tax=Orchesella cincta TaxID=48709 RepID=A0A1D2MFQ6_ORCCI|nr:Transmembrane protein [Orchesella cincta]
MLLHPAFLSAIKVLEKCSPHRGSLKESVNFLVKVSIYFVFCVIMSSEVSNRALSSVTIPLMKKSSATGGGGGSRICRRSWWLCFAAIILSEVLIGFQSGVLVEGKIVKGRLTTHEKWRFLDRFCFLSMAGMFQYEIEYDSQYGYVSLLLYPDLQWGNAYNNPKAKVHTTFTTTEEPEEEEETVTSTKLVCTAKRNFRSARERWWFITVSSCNNTRGLDVKYKFRMTNGFKGDYWYEHFSADEFYILPILTGFCFVYLFLLFSAILFAVELKCRQLLHVTYKLFMVSLALQNAGIVALCIAYGNYASNGIGLPYVKFLGRVLEGLGEFIFMLLLLLLAKGYTVTRGRLRVASAIKLTLFNCSYLVIYALLFLFEQYTFDPGLVLYIYESPAGYGILVLRIVGWFMFVYAIFFTLKHYPEKSSFYLPFFGIYSLWFLSGPVVILISNHAIDKWVREKVAISIQHFCMFVGHVIFLMLTRPSAANKSFPYHVRTTQVGANSSDNFENDQMDHFDAHCYAPTYVDANGRTVDIFTVTGVLQRGATVNGTAGRGPNLDVFNAGPTIIPASAPPAVPALFPMPPPKYVDAFPHQEPGQVEEMLKEPDESDLETDRSIGSDAHDSTVGGSEAERNGGSRVVSGQPPRTKDRNHPRHKTCYFSDYPMHLLLTVLVNKHGDTVETLREQLKGSLAVRKTQSFRDHHKKTVNESQLPNEICRYRFQESLPQLLVALAVAAAAEVSSDTDCD